MYTMQKNAERFPVQSTMARDFLAIQGSSAAVERLFSYSGKMVSPLRCSLKATTIDHCQCLRDWLQDTRYKEEKPGIGSMVYCPGELIN
jgi:hypothetical protein